MAASAQPLALLAAARDRGASVSVSASGGPRRTVFGSEDERKAPPEPALMAALSAEPRKRRGILAWILGSGSSSNSSPRPASEPEKAPRGAPAAGDLGTVHIPPMRETLEANDEIRVAFAQYARSHYLTESMNFLQGLIDYKGYFWEKPDSWRKHKCQVIYHTYLEVGSTLEVNVSEHARKRCKANLDRVMSVKHPDCKQLFEMFDECERAITDMISAGAWRKFMSERRATPHREASFGSASTPGGGGDAA